MKTEKSVCKTIKPKGAKTKGNKHELNGYVGGRFLLYLDLHFNIFIDMTIWNPIKGIIVCSAHVSNLTSMLLLLQIPFCVVVGWIMGKDMDLNFQLFETATLFITVLVVAFMLQVCT